MIAEPEIALAGLAKGISGSDIAFAKCANAIAGYAVTVPRSSEVGFEQPADCIKPKTGNRGPDRRVLRNLDQNFVVTDELRNFSERSQI